MSRTHAQGCADFQRSWAGRQATRREALQAGALSAIGFGLPQLFARQAQARANVSARINPRTAAKARSCILIFMWGGPSQLDTWDPKPDAPAGVRGEFKPIATKTPGVFISEHFPLLAQRSDRLAIIRSMSHDDPAHLSPAHRLFTGNIAPVPNSDRDGPSPKDWPCLGSMLTKIATPSPNALPTAVTMPWTVAHPAAPGGRAPGQHGGWLGKAYDPLLIEGDPNARSFRVGGLDLPDGLTPDRLRDRRALLDQAASGIAEGPASAWRRHQERALDALASAEARGAFRIDREDPKTRDRYGRHIHGQCLLLARRLVESGVSLVTVNWHNDGRNFWDTHGDNFNNLKNRLMPPADQGFSALLDDLNDRSLLDETLVVWIGEFGRNPKITAANAGREHWPRCYSAVLAGGGTQGGTVYGASDRWAAYPALNPVRPEDITATILDRLGVDPSSELADPLGRPLKLTPGRPLAV